jgi:hypothetical protein
MPGHHFPPYNSVIISGAKQGRIKEACLRYDTYSRGIRTLRLPMIGLLRRVIDCTASDLTFGGYPHHPDILTQSVSAGRPARLLGGKHCAGPAEVVAGVDETPRRPRAASGS